MKLRCCLVVAGLVAAPLAAKANLIVNGGFEAPLLMDANYGVFDSIPGWTKTPAVPGSAHVPGIEIQRGVKGLPYEGLQHVELDSHCELPAVEHGGCCRK